MDVSRLVLAPGRLKAFHREALEDQAGQVCGTRERITEMAFCQGKCCATVLRWCVCISGSLKGGSWFSNS